MLQIFCPEDLQNSNFKYDQVCAVSGLINNDPKQNGFCKNWRSRHLFKEEFDFGTEFHDAKSLTTYGTILRRSAVLDVGNFNPSLRHSEDKDLGKRLLNAGYKIIGDPNLIVYSMKNDSVLSLNAFRWYLKVCLSMITGMHQIKRQTHDSTGSQI